MSRWAARRELCGARIIDRPGNRIEWRNGDDGTGHTRRTASGFGIGRIEIAAYAARKVVCLTSSFISRLTRMESMFWVLVRWVLVICSGADLITPTTFTEALRLVRTAFTYTLAVFALLTGFAARTIACSVIDRAGRWFRTIVCLRRPGLVIFRRLIAHPFVLATDTRTRAFIERGWAFALCGLESFKSIHEDRSIL